MTEHLTKETFLEKITNFEKNEEWIYEGKLPCIIDFSADSWCQPCKRLSPILDELSTEYEGKINIYKIDVDEETELASLFKIRSVPTLFFIKNNNEPPTINTGAPTKKSLIESIEKILI
jgi:thioredoxin 1